MLPEIQDSCQAQSHAAASWEDWAGNSNVLCVCLHHRQKLVLAEWLHPLRVALAELMEHPPSSSRAVAACPIFRQAIWKHPPCSPESLLGLRRGTFHCFMNLALCWFTLPSLLCMTLDYHLVFVYMRIILDDYHLDGWVTTSGMIYKNVSLTHGPTHSYYKTHLSHSAKLLLTPSPS